MFGFFKDFGSKIEKVTMNWDWDAINTGITITTLILGLGGSYVSKKMQQKQISMDVEEAVKRLNAPK